MGEPLRALTARLGSIAARFMFARYLLASICALSSDMAAFLMLSRIGATPMLAAFGGYAVGLVVHWVISIRFVFDTGAGPSNTQRVAFVVSALIGMGITIAMVGGLSAVGIAPATAKLISVPASFLSVYAIRKYGIFARS
ncbi:GtrA family protein [Sphingobium scionense]|uniref:Putative flippase GtrA n=1 Tax=Sphingobium scionense TaxID=1404341 RepID=A0A7W6LTP0_9SPHN|nr:GtrA family protein [Sphingobium scionense]MBB4150264.1 putative flippase GtrA [Sphingobium scionense]